MKIAAVLGSPRKNSNSSFLAQKILEAASEKGAETETFILNKLDFRGCQACRGCKEKSDACVLKDDLTPVLAAIHSADAVVLGTGVYFGDVTGQFKSFFDRTYSFFEDGFVTRIKPGKKAVLIVVQAQKSEKIFADIAPRYNMFLQMYGFKTQILRAVGHHDAGSAQNDEALAAQAREIGAQLMA